MPSRQPHEHIFQACLARGQVLQLASLLVDGFEQRRDGQMRLLHIQRDQALVLADGLDAGQSTARPAKRRRQLPLTENSTT